MGYTFHKSERLCSLKAIEALFQGRNRSLSAYPVRVVYALTETPGVRILVSVSKRRFHHAVDRNRAKRQIREAYRLHRDILTGIPQGKGMDIAFLWLSSQHVPSATVSSRVTQLLERINNEISA